MTDEPSNSIRIRQYNLNKSLTAQHTISNTALHEDFDILLIQEPYLCHAQLTRTNRNWTPLYPYSQADNLYATRSLILVNSRISTDAYDQIPIPGTGDVTAMRLTSSAGDIFIFNIYNDCNHSQALDSVRRAALDLRLKYRNPLMIWAGDFNRHHEWWDKPADHHLFTDRAREEAQLLIDLTADFEMEMALEPGVPTLEHMATKNEYRVDNVFVSADLTDRILICEVHPGEAPAGADHYPIDTTLDLATDLAEERRTRNFRLVDWKAFNDELSARLPTAGIPNNLHAEQDVDLAVNRLTGLLQGIIEDTIKESRTAPYNRRWWNTELETLRTQYTRAKRASHKLRGVVSPVHDEARQLSVKYKRRLEETKSAHWEEFLEDLDPQELWIANKYISSPGLDGGKVRVPSLKFNMPDGTQKEVASNEEKGRMLARMFFPKRPPDFQATAPDTFPEPVPHSFVASLRRTSSVIARLKPFKVCGPDGIPNVVLMKCSGALAPILTRIYEAVFRLNHYPLAWKRWTTIVLKKPGKPRYDLAKAWRPIALLNTMGKVLTALATEDMVEMCEKHSLLPAHHFGGRPGRTTSDALHTLTTKIKRAWGKGKVVSALFLDIEAAFPNAVTDQLLTNLRKRRIPTEFINFVRNLLSNRQTTMVFDDYKSDWIDVNNGIGQGDPISMILYLFYNADLVDVPAVDRGEAAIAYVDDVTFIAEAKTIQGAHHKLTDMMTRRGGGYEWSTIHNSRFEASKLRVINFTPGDIEHPTLRLRGQEVTREPSYKILGIIIDEHLRWKEQTAAALSKTVQWINA